MTLTKVLCLFALITGTAPALADVVKRDLNKMPLNQTPIKGVSSAMVSGAMDAEGVFAANAIMKDGSVFPPHTHPDARISIVLEGTMYLGVGKAVDKGSEKAFKAGTVALTPAGVPHWMAARGGEVRILEIGVGPTVTDWTQD